MPSCTLAPKLLIATSPFLLAFTSPAIPTPRPWPVPTVPPEPPIGPWRELAQGTPVPKDEDFQCAVTPEACQETRVVRIQGFAFAIANPPVPEARVSRWVYVGREVPCPVLPSKTLLVGSALQAGVNPKRAKVSECFVAIR